MIKNVNIKFLEWIFKGPKLKMVGFCEQCIKSELDYLKAILLILQGSVVKYPAKMMPAGGFKNHLVRVRREKAPITRCRCMCGNLKIHSTINLYGGDSFLHLKFKNILCVPAYRILQSGSMIKNGSG